MIYSYSKHIPLQSISKIKSWVKDLDVDINVVKARKTKLGDFKVRNGKMSISINCNLNQYAFLITLTHELAHAFIYKKYKNTVKPHGKEWQFMFRKMLLNFLSPIYFPESILRPLSLYIKKPKAATCSDINLSLVLRDYDSKKKLIISEIKEGDLFQIHNGRSFIKGSLLRKRFKCVEKETKRVYLFSPLTVVKKY